MNTHGKIARIGDTTVFIDGIPDECDHKWDGPLFYVSESGKFIDYKTHVKWASYTDAYRQRVICNHYRDIGDPILESGVTCSKCGKPFKPDFR